jgi:hypothetical protein
MNSDRIIKHVAKYKLENKKSGKTYELTLGVCFITFITGFKRPHTGMMIMIIKLN